MTTKIALHHKTSYRYDRLVQLSPHIIRLRPTPHCKMSILAYSLTVTPKNYFINWQQDPFGNYLARIVFPEKSRELMIEIDLIAELPIINPFDFFLENYVETYPFCYDSQLSSELFPYFKKEPSSYELQTWLHSFSKDQQNTMTFLNRVNEGVSQRIQYVSRMDPGVQSCVHTLKTKTGSCRDLAWLLVQTLRYLGFAARFTSGYLIQLKSNAPLQKEAHPILNDFTDLHAWVEVYLPGAGWIGLDPTSGLLVGENHIPLCCTPDPISSAPVTGQTDLCQVDFNVNMSVKTLIDVAPLSKPFSENEWQYIDKLGKSIDLKLNAMDVRLTMGAEPTFVSQDHPEENEWSIFALGKQKKEMADSLLQLLFYAFAKGGVIQYGQGKWCSGELQPRWSLNCYWRKDGLKIWTNQDLLAAEMSTTDYCTRDLQPWMNHLVEQLHLSPEFIRTAYEKDTEAPQGLVLPLAYDEENEAWISEHWHFAQNRLTLTPGDLALGYRLPLTDIILKENLDLTGSVETPAQSLNFNTNQDECIIKKNTLQNPLKSTDRIITAVCIEIRRSHLFVFLPPLKKVTHYFNLLSKIENVAEKLSVPLVLEGYDPPRDPLLLGIHLTPDPGVLEVNIQPIYCWNELVTSITTLYEKACLVRLTTEKFMLDGRQVGTGGGCHITLGGQSCEDSPFLRRPDLLRSFLLFFQNHPSLSYLFSGQYIGPTSQAPRIDEARHESLYELEIALQQLPMDKACDFELINRLLRHLLVDMTGNTHRTEICIDKLFSPDTLMGRQGLIELRAFEMCPNSSLCLLQMLLIRTFVCHFWEQPYQGDLIRWGTELHDKFMLPHFIWQDFNSIITLLNREGYDFNIEWFQTFFEFRFPQYGEMHLGDIHLELRMALEPWNVLGEEIAHSSSSRTVDVATERLQIKITGINTKRHIVTCNHRILPLHPTGKLGEYIAGIRFKAWQLPSTLHPNLPVNKVLVFDVYDKWNKCSLGGCTYYVSHPGGRTYDNYPINAEEAEGRRISRFKTHGHSPNMKQPSIELPNNECPYTLDLRRRPQH